MLRRARELPPNSDAALLFSDAFLFGDQAPGPQARPRPAKRPGRLFAVLGITVLSAVLAAGLVLLAGRRNDDGQAAAAPARDSDRLGPFRLLGTLGAGGMGVVYKAEDTSLDRLVALKRMRDEIAADPRERERFLKEARIVSGLDHPGIVRIHSIHEGPEGTFLVFEYVEGRTLSQAIGERGRFSLPEARAVLAQCAEAVAYAHSKGVVHRDLKPSNIMLDDQGRVRVMDFGVARAAKDALTRLTAQATVAGTPPYMSPEQEEGVTSPACDVYALGVCLYEMLTGKLPYQATGLSLLAAKHAGKVPPLSESLGREAPAGVNQVLAKALAPDPGKRFASPRDLIAALEGVPA
jgi:serine/threonine-protein kinase